MAETALKDKQEASSSKQDATKDTVSIELDALLIGRPLQQPIFDDKGVLLLAEGATITSEIKQQLKERKVQSVQVHKDEVSSLTLTDIEDDEATGLQFDTELTKKIDGVIESGILKVNNAGPSLKQSMVFHGKKAFNAEKREELMKQHQETSDTLDTIMKDASSGDRIDGMEVNRLATAFLGDMTEDSDQALSASFEAENKQLSDHCLQMAMLGMALGVELELDSDNVRSIGVAAMVSDWGMRRLPENVRRADRELSDSDFIEVKKHPIHTLDMLESTTGMPRMVPVVSYQVHERPNGIGFPRCRSGITSIHQFARILLVADTYIALTTSKPYRPPLMPYAAMECLLHQAKTRSVDPDVVRCMINILSLFPIGSYVALKDGSVGRVLRRNPDSYTAPFVQIVRDSKGNRADPDSDDSVVDSSDPEFSVVQAIPAPGRKEVSLSPEILKLSLKVGSGL